MHTILIGFKVESFSRIKYYLRQNRCHMKGKPFKIFRIWEYESEIVCVRFCVTKIFFFARSKTLPIFEWLSQKVLLIGEWVKHAKCQEGNIRWLDDPTHLSTMPRNYQWVSLWYIQLDPRFIHIFRSKFKTGLDGLFTKM